MAGRNDTVFALCSAPGRAAVAVIRVSGAAAGESFRLARLNSPIPARQASNRRLFDLSNGNLIDDALLIWFPAPRSYTGEDTAEIQVHGGRSVIGAVMDQLAKLPGFRPAEAGEFTRRAVENGRFDLTRAEGIADLISADTEAQRRLALAQYNGGLASLYDEWRNRLIRAAAWIEAHIDFPEEDLPEGVWDQTRDELANLRSELQRHLDDGRRGELIREGFHVAVLGAPNVGKSSLVNALARRDVAIVSDVPGTTRDVIEIKLDLAGYAVILADTAGLRETSDPVEVEGVRRARAQADDADLRLLVMDARETDSEPLCERADLVVFNKADLVADRREKEIYVSAKTGEGLDVLINALANRAGQRSDSGEAPLLTRARHRYAVEAASSSIAAAIDEAAPELAAEQLRRALREIGRITGAVDLDDLLDVVFRDFCIGK